MIKLRNDTEREISRVVQSLYTYGTDFPGRIAQELYDMGYRKIEQAEARIAELEQSLRSETLARRVDAALLHEYERRFAEAAKVHYRDTPSAGWVWCPEDQHRWPCPTAVALGLNEGENEK